MPLWLEASGFHWIEGAILMTNFTYEAALAGRDTWLPPSAGETAGRAEDGQTTLQLVELLLKEPGRLDELNRDPARQAALFPRFLGIALTSYLMYSFTMVLILNFVPVAAHPGIGGLRMPPAQWSDGTALSLPLAYTISIVLAACVCLPSFYFYSLLGGVRLSWLQIVSIVGKGTAANAVMLLGVLPIYVAAVLGLIVFAAPMSWLQWTLALGLLLPFVAGLWGMRAIYKGILDAAATMPETWRCRRHCFLRRLTLAWAAVYTAVAPVMIYRLWEYLAS
jgi:hypothetical protein